MKYRVIGLVGAKGSGKDTVGQMLTEICGAKTIAFADPIKDVVTSLFDLADIDQYDAFKRTNVGYTLPGHLSHTVPGRHVVREIGMLMRHYDEQQFNRYVKEKITQQPDMWWVVTDVRFDNEYIMLREMGASIVKIDRPGYKYDGHITERGFDDSLVDYTIPNVATKEELRTKVRDIFAMISKEKK